MPAAISTVAAGSTCHCIILYHAAIAPTASARVTANRRAPSRSERLRAVKDNGKQWFA
jgi:hypothetical protein